MPCECTAKVSDFFGIGLIKIYLIGSIVPIFKNRKKVQYHSTLLYKVYTAPSSQTEVSRKMYLGRTFPEKVLWKFFKLL